MHNQIHHYVFYIIYGHINLCAIWRPCDKSECICNQVHLEISVAGIWLVLSHPHIKTLIKILYPVILYARSYTLWSPHVKVLLKILYPVILYTRSYTLHCIMLWEFYSSNWRIDLKCGLLIYLNNFVMSFHSSLHRCSDCSFSIRHWCILMEISISHWSCGNAIINHVNSDCGKLLKVSEVNRHEWWCEQLPSINMHCQLDYYSSHAAWQHSLTGIQREIWWTMKGKFKYSGHIYIYVHDEVNMSIKEETWP